MVLEIIALICILPLFFYSLCVITETYICNNGEWDSSRLPITLFVLSLISCILLFIHLVNYHRLKAVACPKAIRLLTIG